MADSFDDDGGAAIPLVHEGGGRFVAASAYWRGRCDELFEKDSRHVFTQYRERSWKSHKHFFASVNEAWANLPEKYAGRYPTPTHLRKEALVANGFYEQREFIASTRDEALRIAKFLRSDRDSFAVISVHERAVVERIPMSQSQKVMGRKEFQRSKDEVMAYAWNLVGVDPAEAAGEIGSHA